MPAITVSHVLNIVYKYIHLHTHTHTTYGLNVRVGSWLSSVIYLLFTFCSFRPTFVGLCVCVCQCTCIARHQLFKTKGRSHSLTVGVADAFASIVQYARRIRTGSPFPSFFFVLFLFFLLLSFPPVLLFIWLFFKLYFLSLLFPSKEILYRHIHTVKGTHSE